MFTEKRVIEGIEIHTESLRKKTRGKGDIAPLTADVNRLVQESSLNEGQAAIFLAGSKAGLSTLESDSALPEALAPSLTVPFEDQELCLGEDQEIVLIELDDRPRERKVVVQIIGR